MAKILAESLGHKRKAHALQLGPQVGWLNPGILFFCCLIFFKKQQVNLSRYIDYLTQPFLMLDIFFLIFLGFLKLTRESVEVFDRKSLGVDSER